MVIAAKLSSEPNRVAGTSRTIKMRQKATDMRLVEKTPEGDGPIPPIRSLDPGHKLSTQKPPRAKSAAEPVFPTKNKSDDFPEAIPITKEGFARMMALLKSERAASG